MTTTATPVFDPAQLHRRTLGDAHLQIEVLSLFSAEVERLMRQVEDAEDAQVRADRLRAMITTALNVGAARLAQAARTVETQIGLEAPDLEPLKSAVGETLDYVRQTGI